jgi:hypothetical protein
MQKNSVLLGRHGPRRGAVHGLSPLSVASVINWVQYW